MEEFESRLAAAYEAWHETRGRSPDRFFTLFSDDIALHSILEASLNDTMRGPFIGKPAAIAYFAAIAEQLEMLDAGLGAVVARDGLAVHFLEMFDSYGCARALGLVDPPAGD